MYLDSSQVVRIEHRSLVELYLRKMAFEQGFQLKIRGNTGTQGRHLSVHEGTLPIRLAFFFLGHRAQIRELTYGEKQFLH